MKNDGSCEETSIPLLSSSPVVCQRTTVKTKCSPSPGKESATANSKRSWNCIRSSSTTSLDQIETKGLHTSHASLQIPATYRRSSDQSPVEALQRVAKSLLLPAAVMSRKTTERWRAEKEVRPNLSSHGTFFNDFPSHYAKHRP